MLHMHTPSSYYLSKRRVIYLVYIVSCCLIKLAVKGLRRDPIYVFCIFVLDSGEKVTYRSLITTAALIEDESFLPAQSLQPRDSKPSEINIPEDVSKSDSKGDDPKSNEDSSGYCTDSQQRVTEAVEKRRFLFVTVSYMSMYTVI